MRIIMNNKEEFKSIVIQACVNGKLTVKEASIKLGFSERYVKKLKARFKSYGVQSMLHGNCGRQPAITIDPSIKSKIITIRKLPEYEECNTMQFMELLEEHYAIKISYSALTNLFNQNGIKSPRKRRKTKIHNRRKRKDFFGELIQTDATPHEFFYNDNQKYSLHGFIDDATGKVLGLYMCKNECMQGYLEITRQMLIKYGIPSNIYADGSSIFFPINVKQEVSLEDQLNGIVEPSTQYGRMMHELGITLIHAHSSQAKGRVERLWNTLHDRLRTEFRINNITNLEDANAFLLKYIPKFNSKFAKKAKSNESKFISLPKYVNLDYLLSVKEFRTIDASNSFSFNSKLFKIDSKENFHKKRLTICISQKIGMKAYFNGKFYNVIPIDYTTNEELDKKNSTYSIINNFVYFYCLKNERLSKL